MANKPTSPAEDLNEIMCRLALFGRAAIGYVNQAEDMLAQQKLEADTLREQLGRARDGECCKVQRRSVERLEHENNALKARVSTLETMIAESRKG